MATEVSVLDKYGETTYYSNYADARMDIINSEIEHPLVQIWADLDEQIILLDEADIWIAPGVTIRNSSTTIIAPTTGNLNCKIYGYGTIKNTSTGNCIYISNGNAKLSIECDLIEGTGGSGSVSVNIQVANEFQLTCNKVSNRDNQAIRIGELSIPGLILYFNLKIIYLETGNDSSTFTGTTAITSRGNGFIEIEKIICKNRGHCLSHREGNVLASIKKSQSTNNISGDAGAAIHIRQYDFFNPGIGVQKLILYFDEIDSLKGSINSTAGVEVGEGTGVFIGRKIYSKNSPAIQIQGDITKGYIKCNEVISQGNNDEFPINAVELSNFTNQIIVDANFIIGYRDSGVVFTNGSANFILKNAKIINTFTSSSESSVGIFIFGGNQNIALSNVEIITGDLTNGRTIYFANTNDINLKNYGLFVNKEIDTNIKLLIGIENTSDPDYNYLYIVDPILT